MMRKLLVLLIILGLVGMFSIGVLAEKVTSKYGELERENWDAYAKYSKHFTTAEQFLQAVDYFCEEISSFLGVPFDHTIKFVFKDGNASSASVKYTITLGKDIMEPRVVAHQITALMAWSSMVSLSEGLADYIQSTIGTHFDSDTYVPPAYSVAKYLLPGSDPILLDGIVNGGLDVSRFTAADRSIFNLYSYTYVKYLIDTYGVEKFIKYFNGNGYIPAKDIFGVTEEQLKAGWLATIQAAPDLNLEEMKQKYGVKLPEPAKGENK